MTSYDAVESKPLVGSSKKSIFGACSRIRIQHFRSRVSTKLQDMSLE